MKTKLENMSFDSQNNLETIDCPLCKSSVFQNLFKEQGIMLVRCAGCGLVFANPRPDHDRLRQFYDSYFPPESASLWQEQMADVFFSEGLEFIKQASQSGRLQLSEDPKILDIGSGMGFFLKMMKDQGWKVQGIEPSASAVRHAVDHLNVPVYHGTVEHAAVENNYDVVTLWYVLEHVPNPDVIIRKCSELLKAGGLLIIRVPNQNVRVDAWLNRLGMQNFFLMNPPRHLFDYSPGTLTSFLKAENFEVIKIINAKPRKTGTWLELLRRYVWYGFFEMLYTLSGAKIIGGSSMTVYAIKR